MSVTNLYSKRNPKEPEQEKEKEPGLPIKIPVSVIRWVAYTFIIAWALLPFFGTYLTWQQQLSVAAILAHFSSQLNALKEKP